MKKSSRHKVIRRSNNSVVVLGVVCLFLIVGIGVYLLSMHWNRNLVKDEAVALEDVSPEVVVFEKEETWGPCSDDEAACFQYTALRDSGELLLKGKVNAGKTLDYDSVMTVIEKIKESAIMFEDCEADEVLDYQATYKLRIGGMEKTIQYPGCEDKLKEIEGMFLDDIDMMN